MKSAALTILMLLAALAVMFPAGAAPAYALEAGTYSVLLDNTAVYAEPNAESAVLTTLDKDTLITVSDTQKTDNLDWCETVYNGRTGYISAASLYKKCISESCTLCYARISADKKEDDIYIYSAPSAQASKLLEINDGTRILLTGYESGGYLEVEYAGVKGYVAAENIVTGGFTYHQYLAFLVGVVCLAAVVVIGILARMNTKKEKK